MADGSPWIVDGKIETFEQEVIQRSRELPMVVDFWATWCGPCKELGPVLEKLAQEFKGRFQLVKVNVDEQPELAGGFGVQSIPHVFALRDGQAVNQFLGNLPEDQIRTWLDQVLPNAAEVLFKEAQQLEATDPRAAEAKYRAALESAPQHDAVKIGLARVLLAQHRDDESRKLIEQLEARGYLEPEAENVKAELDLREVAEESGSVAELRVALVQAPDNPELQLKLADALAVDHQYQEALELGLQVVQNHKATMGEPARELMVRVFQILGPASELVQEYRRKLAIALY